MRRHEIEAARIEAAPNDLGSLGVRVPYKRGRVEEGRWRRPARFNIVSSAGWLFRRAVVVEGNVVSALPPVDQRPVARVSATMKTIKSRRRHAR